MTKINRIYIAGPYTAKNRAEYELNIGRLYAMSHRVILQNTVPICLPIITAGMEHTFDAKHVPYEYWLDQCFALMNSCDYVSIVPGYENSRGTRREIEYAVTSDIPITYMEEPQGDELSALIVRMTELQRYHPLARYAFDYLFRIQERNIHEDIEADADPGHGAWPGR